MATCIYCRGTANSIEHPIPLGLGNFEGYVPLTEHVCRVCNGRIGILDEHLCRCGPEAFFRKYLELEGRRKHEKANPFYRGSAGGRRLEMVSADQATGKEVRLEVITGNTVRELRIATVTTQNGDQHEIAIPDGISPEQLRRQLEFLGMSKVRTVNVSVPEEEEPQMDALFVAIGSTEKTATARSLPTANSYGSAQIKSTVTNRYLRCIAKIAFHYFLTKTSRFRGHEECFDGIRDFILNESNFEKCGSFVFQNECSLASELRGDGTPSRWGHLLCIEVDQVIRVKVQLFVGRDAETETYTVLLGTNPLFPDCLEPMGDFFAYHGKGNRSEYDGKVFDLAAPSTADK